LHALELALYDLVEELFAHFGEGQEVDAAVVFGAERLRDVRQEAEVDVVGDEGGERGEAAAEGEEDFKERVEGEDGVVDAVFAL
jgi:hypothetical protein